VGIAAVPSAAGRSAASAPAAGADALVLYEDDGNERITCAAGRRHGMVPVARSHRTYRYMRDGERDGVVCE